MKEMQWERIFYKGKYQFVAYNARDFITIETGIDVDDVLKRDEIWKKITDSFPQACSYGSFKNAYKEAKREKKLYGKYELCA